MFWRILWQLLRASRTRLVVALLTLVSGAAVVSALIDLQLDAQNKLTREFRTLGANVIVAPSSSAGSGEAGNAALMSAAVWEQIQALRDRDVVAAAPYLYVVAQVPAAGGERSVLVTGTILGNVRKMNSWWKVDGAWPDAGDPALPPRGLAGINVARQFQLKPGSSLELRYGARSARMEVTGTVATGGPEDNQIFVELPAAQQLASLAGRIGMVQLSVAGSAAQIQGFVSRLAATLPETQVRPVRQFTAAEEQLLNRIRLLIQATVLLILVLTVLGVLATTAALAMERARDVGLMKAIGGPIPRVLRFFLAEVGILGGLGGLLGYGLGVALAEWLGLRVFGTGISLRLEVLPLTVVLMLGAALAGALPLRLLGRVRPAVILRGE